MGLGAVPRVFYLANNNEILSQTWWLIRGVPIWWVEVPNAVLGGARPRQVGERFTVPLCLYLVR